MGQRAGGHGGNTKSEKRSGRDDPKGHAQCAIDDLSAEANHYEQQDILGHISTPIGANILYWIGRL